MKGHFDYCERNGQEGFSHLVVKSFNAGDDHRVFSENAVSGGEILDFERSFMKADGTLGEVAFSLAFARAPASPDTTFFACQIVKALPGGRGSLINHANGALATNRVILSARLPKKYLAFFQVFLETQPDQIETGLKFETATGALHVISAQADDFGVAPPGEPGLKLQALVLQVADLKVTRQLLAKNNISVHDKMNRIIVPPALGQGGTLVFEE